MAWNTDYYGPPSELSEEQVVGLWARFTKERDQDSRDRLIEHYMLHVYQTAERMAARLPSHIDTSDLINWGCLGLIDAVNRFEPERGNKFSTFCTQRIRGAILDELRRLDWAPRQVRRKSNQLERMREELGSALGRPPSDDELAEALEMNDAEYDDLLKETQVKSMVSLDRKWDENDDNELGHVEMLPDHSATNPLSELERAEIKEVALRGLSEIQQQVLVMYFYDNLSLKEIGMVLDLSESRVCQIRAQMLDFLKEKFSERSISHVDD